MEFYANVDEVRERVEGYFRVEDVFFDAGVLTFVLEEQDIKDGFKRLYRELKPLKLIPTAGRDHEGRITIKVYPYTGARSFEPRIKSLPLILFAATLGTVGVDGFLRASSPIYRLIMGRVTIWDTIIEGLLFTAALMAIIGIHELGHKISAKIDGVDSSPPYFIPGIPTVLPTFGAVIFQKEPIINRDDMFDAGFSGPITGFIVALGVAVAAYMRAVWFTPEEFMSIVSEIERAGGVALPSPLIFVILRPLFGNPGMIPMFTTLGFAAWLGMLITALNLFPVWQLDGGRIFRSILNARQHRIASYVSIAVLAITGYFFFALLLLILMPRTPDIAPLDQVSPLSRGRKLTFIAVFLMMVVSFVPLWI